MPQNIGLHVLPLSDVSLCGGFILVSIHLEPSSLRHTEARNHPNWHCPSLQHCYKWPNPKSTQDIKSFISLFICLYDLSVWTRSSADGTSDRNEQKWSWTCRADKTSAERELKPKSHSGHANHRLHLTPDIRTQRTAASSSYQGLLMNSMSFSVSHMCPPDHNNRQEELEKDGEEGK